MCRLAPPQRLLPAPITGLIRVCTEDAHVCQERDLRCPCRIGTSRYSAVTTSELTLTQGTFSPEQMMRDINGEI
jgi:hypothetical protein